MFLGLDKGHFLSPSGRCKSFDAAADGYSRAEGCGVFVLKRLSDALAENDRIMGVIRGVEVNQSGHAPSITHPHAPTQEALFKQALRCSGIDANSVNLVEAHGTGTQAGDINEMESIRRALSSDRSSDNPLYVTAIKANIGHLEAASGCASLAKVLLMLHHKRIPPQIGLESLNPRIAPLDIDHTVISTETTLWPPAKAANRRIALINNFGAAGSNATLLVEEHVPTRRVTSDHKLSSYVFGISAKDVGALDSLRFKLITWLQDSDNEEISLLDLAYTLTARRQLYAHRLAVTAASKQELVLRLEQACLGQTQPATSSSIVFVFSGQGAHFRGMAPSLYQSSNTFRRCIDECNGILLSSGFSGIHSIIIGSTRDENDSLDHLEEYHAATFSLQYALARVWISWGIRPVAVLGHRSVYRYLLCYLVS